MPTAIDGLKPPLVWKYFAEISRIPRGSKNETAIAKYLVETAKKLGLDGAAGRGGQRARAQARVARAREARRACASRGTWTWSARRTRTRSTTS